MLKPLAEKGNQEAIRNLPKVQNNLATEIADKGGIENLKRAMEILDPLAKKGYWYAIKGLADIQAEYILDFLQRLVRPNIEIEDVD